MFDSLAIDTQQRALKAIRLGMAEGETLPQQSKRLKDMGIFDRSKLNIQTVTRTAVMNISNEAAQLTYKANSAVVKGWTFVSTLDPQTCLICADLSGKHFPVGQGPIPPRHYQCRCLPAPDLMTWRELGFNLDEMPAGTRASWEGEVPADISFDDWLKGQDRAVQEDILGVERTDLYAKGKIKNISNFIDGHGHIMTLPRLREKYNINK